MQHTADTDWQQEIRDLEGQLCKAFLGADIPTLERLWPDDFAVNSPLNKVLGKALVLELLRTGRIRHTAYEFEIEHMLRSGEIVVVMGRDTVTDPPEGKVTQRRYTNVWRRDGDSWRMVGRHANAVPG